MVILLIFPQFQLDQIFGFPNRLLKHIYKLSLEALLCNLIAYEKPLLNFFYLLKSDLYISIL